MDFRRIAGDASVSSIRLFLAILRGLILIPIITRLLGEAVYGTWVVIFAVMSIATSVGGLHLHGALIRFTPRETIPGQTLVDTASLAILSAAVISSFIWVLDWSVNLLPTVAGSHIIIVFVLLLSLKIVLGVLKNYPRANNRVKSYEIIEISYLIVEVSVLAFVFWYFQSVVLALWALVGVTSLFLLALGGRYFPRDASWPNLRSLRYYLQYSVPMVPKQLGHRFLTNADKYLLNVFTSPTVVAIYAVSYSVAAVLQNITGPLNPTLYPAVANAWEANEFDELSHLYEQVFRWYTLIGIPAVFGLSILSEPLLAFISTEQIAQRGTYVLPALALGFFIRGYDNPLEYIFNAAEKNVILAKISIIAALINVLLNIFLIPVVGIAGAVTATLLSYALVAAYIYVKAQNEIVILFPFWTAGKATFAALLMAGVLLALPIELTSLAQFALYPILGVVVYTFLLIAIGELRIEMFTRALKQ